MAVTDEDADPARTISMDEDKIMMGENTMNRDVSLIDTECSTILVIVALAWKL